MRSHEHALISIAYAGGVALLAGHSLYDPGLYIAAIAGGELIDFIDYPLYHLVYRRNDPPVRDARALFISAGATNRNTYLTVANTAQSGLARPFVQLGSMFAFLRGGLAAAISYLNRMEDDRKFQGLLLHNIYSLGIVTLFCLLGSLFISAPHYLFVFAGAWILHMLTDIIGDFVILGHADNWLWVIPQGRLDWLGRLGDKLPSWTLIWTYTILTGMLVVTFRWVWQVNHPNLSGSLSSAAGQYGLQWMSYIPLLGLVIWQIWLALVCAGAAHKYDLEMGASGGRRLMPLGGESVRLIVKYLRGRVPRSRRMIEHIYLSIQSDLLIWACIVASIIVVALSIVTWLQIDSDVLIFILPLFFALLAGSLIHTTVGEFGGAYGVTIAWLLNLLLGRLGLLDTWPVTRAYWIGSGALVAWLLGLLGGMARGPRRMSLAAFCVRIRYVGTASDRSWIRNVLHLTERSLLQGFEHTHKRLFGSLSQPDLVHAPLSTVMLTSDKEWPQLGRDYYHLKAKADTVPLLREIGYVLCQNRLTARSDRVGSYGLLPMMPRHRCTPVPGRVMDATWSQDAYRWHSRERPISFPGLLGNRGMRNQVASVELYKTWGEILDHLVTRHNTVECDLLVYPGFDGDDTSLVVCGLIRDVTSTKEYSTIESETYAGAVMRRLLAGFTLDPSIALVRYSATRMFSPATSFYDSEPLFKRATMPLSEEALSPEDSNLIKQAITIFPKTNFIANATAAVSRTIRDVFFQTVIAAILAAVWAKNSDALIKLIKSLLQLGP